jgi:tetratricopeptide (TPR) repeat protein
MTLQTIEPVLYLPDDTPFFAEPGDVGHTLRLAWRAAGFLGLCVLAYLPVAIWGGVVWQDEFRVTENVLLWGLNGLASIWGHATVGHYRPLAQTLLWGEHHLFHNHPLGYHLVSIVLHALDASLLWMVLRRLGIRGAWLGAALFAVHPIQVQTVAWISQQSHLIGAGFILGAIWAFLRLSRILPAPDEEFAAEGEEYNWDDLLGYEPVKRLYAVALLLAVAASLCDPLALTLPIVFVLLIWWKRGSVRRDDWLRLAPFIALALAGTVMTLIMVGRAGGIEPGGEGPALTVLQRLAVDCRSIWASAATIVWPYPMLFVYARWSVIGWQQWTFVAALLAVIALGWAARKRIGRGFLAACLLFVALLLPGLGSVLVTPTPPIYVADHWAYLAAAVPLAAIAWTLVAAMSWFTSATVVRSLRVAAAVVCIGGLGFLAWNQEMIYDREESVWQDALAYEPASSVAVVQYVHLLIKHDQETEAADVLARAQDAGADSASLLPARVELYLARGRYSDAIQCYRVALDREPHNLQYLAGLADAQAKNNEFDNAIQTYRALLSRRPNDVGVRTDMAIVLLDQNKLDQAIAELRSVIATNPRFVTARLYLSIALLQKGDLPEAANQLKEVIAVDPGNADAFNIAGKVLLGLHYYSEAEQMFRAVVQLQPKEAYAWDRLGLAQAEQGPAHLREAVWSFDRASQLNPDSDAMRLHLAKARHDLAAGDQPPATRSSK